MAGNTRGGPPPGKQVQIPHDVLLAKLKAMNMAGDHQGVLTFGDKQPAVVGSSPALLTVVAEAAVALKRNDRAEALRRQVLTLEPGHPSTTNNLAVLLIRRDAFDEAEALCRGLLESDPDHVEARYNLCLIHLRRCELADAEAQARQVLQRRPNHERAPFVIGLSLLTQGRYAEGWPGFEARMLPVNSAGNIITPNVPYPAWNGQPLEGKSILVWMEQGLGDEIMMARFAPELKARGAAQVSWICKPAMAPLLRRVGGIDTLYVAQGQLTMPRHDYWVLPMSLPKHLGVTLETVPADIPYIEPVHDLLSAATDEGAFRVGLVWKGSALLANDRNRSLPNLETLKGLWDVPGVEFVSLQKGEGEEQGVRPPAGQPLTNVSPQLSDLGATAAVIQGLDLVITVDTAVAHLAGALGKPCFVMLPQIGLDWRWLTGRSDSPWYPTLTLFRQTTSADWSPVVAQMARALRELVQAKAAKA